jgi:hypothetical protein
MDDILFHVRPTGHGWLVDGAAAVQPLVFYSGAKAEAQAHALARTLAGIGRDTRVLVHDRSQQIVGSTRYFAPDPIEA